MGMKSFDSPGDVARAFEFLRKKTWERATPMDRAMFISMLQSVPAAYSTLHTITAPDVSADAWFWKWYDTPASLGSPDAVGLGSFSRRKFWDAGIKLPQPGKINGWYFVPEYILLGFYTTGSAYKASRIDTVLSFMRDSEPSLASSPDQFDGQMIAFQDIAANVKRKEIFTRDYHAHVGANILAGQLLNTILLPYEESPTSPAILGHLSFSGFDTVIATDIHRVLMEGRWFFSPALIEEQTTSDD